MGFGTLRGPASGLASESSMFVYLCGFCFFELALGNERMEDVCYVSVLLAIYTFFIPISSCFFGVSFPFL